MSQAQIPKNKPVKTKKASRRSRKKRRTEDFSSSSDDSSSDSDNDTTEREAINSTIDDGAKEDVTMTELDNQDDKVEENEEDNALESHNHVNIDNLKRGTQEGRDATKTELQSISAYGDRSVLNLDFDSKLNNSQASSKVKEARDRLLDQYLGKMTSVYYDDMDALRQQKDFSSGSLVLLAKLLRESGNVFDEQALKSIVKD